MKKRDALGDRMKGFYEDRWRTSLPRRIHGFLRVDGKAFHTFTKNLKKPFDTDLMTDMDETAKYLCENIQGARIGYVQSDEITVLFTDLYGIDSELWFDGNIQKIASISASLATSKFAERRLLRLIENEQKRHKEWGTETSLQLNPIDEYIRLTALGGDLKKAQFDSRVWAVNQVEEAVNVLVWRQQDATRNSVSMVAQSLYSHNDLNKKNSSQLQEMIFQKGQNWNDYPVGQKRGRMIVKVPDLVERSVKAFLKAKDSGDEKAVEAWIFQEGKYFVKRNKWVIADPPIFSQQQDRIKSIIQLGIDYQHG